MKSTTNTDNELVEELKFEFARQCNYILNKSLERQLQVHAQSAAEVCKDLNLDSKSYVAAQVMFAPVLRGYNSLTPQQLCSKDSRIYVKDYITLSGKRDYEREF